MQQAGRPPEGLSRIWTRWTRSQSEVEAEELQREFADEDLSRIDCCEPGHRVSVQGTVRSLTLRPQGRVPALEIDLYDGSGSVTVIWLGRRRIPGIEAGRTMVVCGRLTGTSTHPTIYNPRYELKPRDA